MFLTPDELKNIIVLCEVGAKTLSNDKGLQESAAIQNTALLLLQKIKQANEQQVTPVVDTLETSTNG
jgi:hypothetical protein